MRNLTRLALGLLFLGAAPAVAHAQDYATDQGSLIVGGSASLSSNGVDDSDAGRITVLNLSPSVEYFVAPGLALGATATLSRLSDDDDSNTTYGIGPVATYFFGATSQRPYYPFVSAQLQFARSGSGDDASSVFGYGASAGVMFMLSRSVGLNPALYYRHAEETDTDFGTNSFGISVGVTAFVF